MHALMPSRPRARRRRMAPLCASSHCARRFRAGCGARRAAGLDRHRLRRVGGCRRGRRHAAVRHGCADRREGRRGRPVGHPVGRHPAAREVHELGCAATDRSAAAVWSRVRRSRARWTPGRWVVRWRFNPTGRSSWSAGRPLLTRSGTDGILIERFNSNGSIDGTFGSHGVVTVLTSQLGDGYARRAATGRQDHRHRQRRCQRQRRRHAARRGRAVERQWLARLRALAPAGSMCSTLAPTRTRWRLAVQTDGKIVIGGSQAPGLQVPNALIARLTAGGALDPSFGSGGAYAHQYARGGLELRVQRARDPERSARSSRPVLRPTATPAQTRSSLASRPVARRTARSAAEASCTRPPR